MEMSGYACERAARNESLSSYLIGGIYYVVTTCADSRPAFAFVEVMGRAASAVCPIIQTRFLDTSFPLVSSGCNPCTK
jgi:hypothetical protein